MADWQVTCIIKRGDHYDPHERISHIGNQSQSWMMTEDAAIQSIESGTESFYTSVNGRRVQIVVANHLGRKYLKTDADGFAPNNLLRLPECYGCKTVG